MAKKDTFEKMYDLYNAIVDIDRIINSTDDINQNGECKLDQVLFYVKDIPKSEYNPQIAAEIINSIRTAIVEIYSKTAQEINNDIGSGMVSMGCRQESPIAGKIPVMINPTQVQNNFGLGARKNNVERGMIYAAGQQTN